MREYSTPLTSRSRRPGNLTDDVVRNAARPPTTSVFSRPSTGDGWQDVTAAEFLAEVCGVAKGLVAAGIEAGDRVGADLARPATSGPCSTTRSGSPARSRCRSTRPRRPSRSRGSCATPAPGPWSPRTPSTSPGSTEVARRPATSSTTSGRSADNAVDVLTSLGDDVADDELEKRRTTATPRDLATLIYTSGTTGRPKGCMLTHGNFMFELGVAVARARASCSRPRTRRTLLFLPLAHVFARIIQVGCVKSRARLGHSADIKNLRRRPAGVPADVRPRRAAGVREGLQHRVAASHRRRPGQDLRPGRRDRDRLLHAGSTTGRVLAASCAPSTRCSTGSSTASCATRSAAAARTPSPAARRSASGSATSTAASG